MCIHLPMLFLYWRKCHFLSYSYIRCLIKAPTEQLKIYAYFENSQTAPWGPFDSPEGWVHHKICLAIFGLLIGFIWKQKQWPGQQGGPGNGKNQQKNASETLPKLTFWACFSPPPPRGWAQHLSAPQQRGSEGQFDYFQSIHRFSAAKWGLLSGSR